MITRKLISLHLGQNYPDFLDLPWKMPLSQWKGECDRIVQVERGLSRHEVVFVCYDEKIYAIKELPSNLAEHEYSMLKKLVENDLPSVIPVGHIKLIQGEQNEKISIIITEYLESSLPYRTLFIKPGLVRYQEKLINSMAVLLVQLHLAGFFWGDCSLSNTLFRRDAVELQAYFVDAETTKYYRPLSDGKRSYDLDIMEENITGDLADLAVITDLPSSLNIYETAQKIHQQYKTLWKEITQEELLETHERYKIHERINRLHNLGFSVDEIQLIPTENGNQLKMRTIVTEKNYHRHILHSLTGILAEENQARLILNDIHELKAHLSEEKQKFVPLSSAAFYWTKNSYFPTLNLLGIEESTTEAPQIYCQILEHKWFLSEKAKKDIGLKVAVKDYLKIIEENQNAWKSRKERLLLD
ncbi:MAG: DUF4032 domain-containing protein [Candidatus Hodarchaeota archaeon]